MCNTQTLRVPRMRVTCPPSLAWCVSVQFMYGIKHSMHRRPQNWHSTRQDKGLDKKHIFAPQLQQVDQNLNTHGADIGFDTNAKTFGLHTGTSICST
jgi:hypothetical protein